MAEELASGIPRIGEIHLDYALLQDLFNNYDLPSGSEFEESADETTGMILITDSAELSHRLSDSDSELSLINTRCLLIFFPVHFVLLNMSLCVIGSPQS